jgi:hypothetical protein
LTYSTNKISIGTSSYDNSYKLYVAGKIKLLDELYFSSSNTSRIRYGGSNSGELEFFSNNSTGVKGYSALKLDKWGNVSIFENFYLPRGAQEGYILKVASNGKTSWTSPYSVGKWESSNNNIFFNSGNVGIGVTPNANFALQVQGQASVDKLVIEVQGEWPDYVFEEDYDLTSLDEIEEYINENKHLPNVPSSSAINEEGINVGEMNAILLKKIEELTLHLIEQQNKIEQLESKLNNIDHERSN